MSDTPPTNPLAGQRILVALSGGIAGYKVATLVSRLAQADAEVRCIMTDAATKFITPITLQSLSGHPVLTSMWQSDDRPDSQHIGLARWCDVFVLAPASANTIAAIAHGFADNLVTLTASALPSDTQKLFAPAMNADMWANPIVQQNCTTLRDTLGFTQVGPDEGWQACRTQGSGRMSEAEAIRDAVVDVLAAD